VGCTTVICFASSVGFSSSRVTSDQMEVCLLAQWGDVAFRLNSYSRHYSTTFAFSILLYPPGHRPTLRLPTRGGTWWAYRVPSRQPDGLGPSLFAGGMLVHGRGIRSLCTRPHTVWLKPVSIVGSACVTTFITSSHRLSIPSTLAPLRLMLADPSFPHGSDGSRLTVGYIVSGHYTACYLAALPPRVLLMEQQVLFRDYRPCRTIVEMIFTSHLICSSIQF
jgi:hypothetical protein